MAAFIQTLAIAAISGIAVPIFQSLWEGGGKAIDRVGKEISEQRQQLIFTASQKYAQNYTERHGTLKVLEMREPVSLESVYTTVQFWQDDHLRRFEALETQEANFRQGQRRRFSPPDTPTQDGFTVANQHQYLMVLGAPGAGKSTFLKRMGLEALKGSEGQFYAPCIPVFIELKRFDSDVATIERFITKEFEISGFPAPESFTQKALEQGKLLILLDGLDEVPHQHLNRVMAQIQDFVDAYAANRYIISGRLGAIKSSFSRFTDVIVADFNDQQIQEYIQRWFNSEEDQALGTAKTCWELLQKPNHAAAKELAHTPLLLTFLCRVYDRSQNFPDNRSVLYRKALRILLEEWVSEKRVQPDQIYQGFHTEVEEILLSEIAYQGFIEDRFFFSKRELVELIRQFLQENLNAPSNLNGEAILNAIVMQQGILVKRAEEVYSFSHVTLQEYLTAQYIVDHNLMSEVVKKHVLEGRWHEVLVLISGLMRGGADELLLLLEEQALELLITPEGYIPCALLQWADGVIAQEDRKYEPTAKRAIAIALALALTPARPLAQALAPALTRALTQVLTDAISKQPLLDLAQQLKTLEIFRPEPLEALLKELAVITDPPPESIQSFTQTLKQACLKAFALSPDWVNLSDSETQVLRHYFYIYQLMVRCKQAAVRISAQTWQEIESRMLRV